MVNEICCQQIRPLYFHWNHWKSISASFHQKINEEQLLLDEFFVEIPYNLKIRFFLAFLFIILVIN